MAGIPTLDISSAMAGDAPQSLVDELRVAMTTVGFLHIVGHGIAPELLDRGHDAIVHIDQMPDAGRKVLHRPRGESRGLFEKCAADGRILQRGFQFIPYDDLAAAEVAGAVGGHPDYFAANVWPNGDDDFKATWVEISSATRHLGTILIGLFARALGADVDFFAGAFTKDVTLFSANWYPRQPEGTSPTEVLNAQHADSGALTMLHQRGTYAGLQVLHRDGRWETVALRPESIIINIGQLMSRWTNAAWPATMHRVLAGPTAQDCRSSIAVHFLPNIDQLIEPLASLTDAGEPKYAPITTYDWQHEFMERYVLAKHDWSLQPA
jgi:isopenicillin N synthase-like dioxygenase